jgi:hypothetical protein
LCITVDGKVGIGTENPSQKLEVKGSILVSGTGDVCNGSGKCLNSIYQTNVMVGNDPTCPSGQTIIAKMNGTTWYDAAYSGSYAKVICGKALTSDGGTLLVNESHTSVQCVAAGGTTVDDGLGNSFCKMTPINNSCPSEWRPYLLWSTTVQSVAGRVWDGQWWCYCSPDGAHTWSNHGREYCTISVFFNGDAPSCTNSYSSCSTYDCSASGESGVATNSVTEIGCY